MLLNSQTDHSMRKVVVAVTGASGSIYADLLIRKMKLMREQWSDLSIILTDNAKDVLATELENKDFANLGLPVYGKNDINAPVA